MSLIESDMKRLSFFERLRLWFRRLISRGSEVDVFVAFRLDQCRARIRAHGRDIIDFETRTVLSGLPSELRPLAKRIARVRGFFEYVWRDTDSLRAVLDYLIARRIPDSKRTLNQFASTQELQETFRAYESRTELKQLVLQRLSAYVDRIPESVLEELETGLGPLYALKDAALFDFNRVFGPFGASYSDAVSDRTLDFQSATLLQIADVLEELYLALYTAGRIGRDPQIYTEVLHLYLTSEEGAAPHASGEPAETPETLELRSAIVAMYREAVRVRDDVPLQDMIREHHRDPYYRFLAYVPKLKLRDFYYNNLKMELLSELDRRFNDIRMGVLGRMTQEVFPKGLPNFDYFHPEIQQSVKRSLAGSLRVYRPLQAIKAFITDVYRGQQLQEFLRILGRISPVRARQIQPDFTLYIAAVDDVAERLKEFDRSFSPDTDDGKAFMRHRLATNDKDRAVMSSFRGLVAQKDREARGIIEKALDQIRGIRRILLGILQSGHDMLAERYLALDSTEADPQVLDKRLEQYARTLETVEKVIKQMIHVENTE